jgi:hypothetical protein
MSKFLISLALILVTSVSSAQSLVERVEDMAEVNDDLGIRILLRQSFKRNMSFTEWNKVRLILAQRPNVGQDLVVAWDRQMAFKGSPAEKASMQLNGIVDRADELLSGMKFDEAFRMYQSVARQIKPKKGDVGVSNQQFYYSLLQQMGRSLYGSKRYAEALEVYGWIPPAYSQIRQVMFEKMWAAFRANRLDMAVGSIASQQSAYFSRYIDPESYLIKIYVFKKLCRAKELNQTVKEVKDFIANIQSGRYTYMEWGKKDVLRLSLVQLITEVPEKKYAYVTEAARQAEKKAIQAYLQQRFEQEKPMILAQLQKILGYSALALQGEQKFLEKVAQLPSSRVLSESGFEYWPASDGEEWQDEIGSHVFIGESQCTK